jgi:hypothetical protein
MTAMPTKSVKCVRDWRDFTTDYYRLPTDGRQWKSQASKRRQLAEYLATFANGDGGSITLGIERMAGKFEVDRATIFRLLDELRELRALAPKCGLVSKHGCAVRALTLDAFVAEQKATLTARVQGLKSQGADVSKVEQFMESQTDDEGVAKS